MEKLSVADDPGALGPLADRMHEQQRQHAGHRDTDHRVAHPPFGQVPLDDDLRHVGVEDHQIDDHERDEDVLGEDAQPGRVIAHPLQGAHVLRDAGQKEPGVVEKDDPEPELRVGLIFDREIEQGLAGGDRQGEADVEHRREEGRGREAQEQRLVVLPEAVLARLLGGERQEGEPEGQAPEQEQVGRDIGALQRDRQHEVVRGQGREACERGS